MSFARSRRVRFQAIDDDRWFLKINQSKRSKSHEVIYANHEIIYLNLDVYQEEHQAAFNGILRKNV